MYEIPQPRWCEDIELRQSLCFEAKPRLTRESQNISISRTVVELGILQLWSFLSWLYV